jgi:hypothetical protein
MYNPLKNGYFLWILMLGLAVEACAIKRMQPSLRASPCQLIQPFKAKHLTIHASIKIQAVSKQHKLRMQWRIQRNKLIWVSIATPWGLEIARARITPKRIELINHVARTYSSYDYTTIQAKWQCPFTYDFLEAILLGELPADFIHVKEEHAHGYTIIRQAKNVWALQAAVKNAIGKIVHWDLVNSLTQDRCQVSYQAFKPYLPGLLFKHAHLSANHVAVHMTYTRVQWAKKSFQFPFSIPTKYAKL